MKNFDSFNNIIGQAYIIVSNNYIINVSQSFINMVDFTEDELLGEDIDFLYNSLRIGPNFKSDAIKDNAEYFLFTKTLEVRFININLIKDDSNEVYIFKEKLNSRLQDKYNYAYQLLSENIVGASIYSVPDFTLLKANQVYLDYIDAPYNTPDKTFGKKIYDFIQGYKGSITENDINDTIASMKSKHFKEMEYHGFARGTTYWDQILTPIMEDGRVKYIITNTQDVTEKVCNRMEIELKNKQLEEQNILIKQQQQELNAIMEGMKHQRDLLEMIVANLHESLYVFKKDGSIILNKTLNKQTCKLNNIKQIFDVVHYATLDGVSIPIEKSPIYKVLNGETTINNIMNFEYKGSEYSYLVNGIPFFNENGEFLYGLINSLDVTEFIKSSQLLNETQLKLLQAEREKSQALQQSIEMKDEFLSLISHELRTPITVIDSAIQAMSLICWDELPDKSKKYIKTIRQNTYRQLRLVNNLLDIIRINSGRIKVNKRNLDIVFLTHSIVENVYTYAAKSGVKLKFVPSISKKILGIDEEKYERILLNLLSNAIKYTPEGKSIIVNLSYINGYICIEVKDSGIGIPEDKIDTIFERFGQVDSLLSRRAEGVGIGLSLVKKFVEALGGTITVKSKIGKGSTFKILLPEDIVEEVNNDNTDMSLLGNRHVDIIKVEFSDIYL